MNQNQVIYTEYTPLVNREYFYVYRQNDSFLERIRRLLVFIITTCLLTILFFFLFSILIRLFIKTEEPYSYYLFTKRWPPTVCKDSNRCINGIDGYMRWTIHGLWPEFSNNTWNQYCRKEPFDMEKISRLRMNLRSYWPNLLMNHTEESLWKHEWEKHGTCTNLTEYEYFKKTLNLDYSFDIERWLSQATIVPDRHRTYDSKQFLTAFAHHIDPSSVVLNCEVHQHRQYINEIMLCFSFDEMLPIPCTVHSTCHGSIYYTGFDKSS